MNPPFKRTVCACAGCTQCCHRQPGSLAPGDYERIQAYLGKTDEEMKELFWASPGAIVLNMATDQFRRVGTITPQRHKSRCVFLNDEERCTIHEVAPVGCAYFDTHMGVREAQERSQWLVHSQQSGEYQKLRSTLPYAKSYKPGRY